MLVNILVEYFSIEFDLLVIKISYLKFNFLACKACLIVTKHVTSLTSLGFCASIVLVAFITVCEISHNVLDFFFLNFEGRNFSDYKVH